MKLGDNNGEIALFVRRKSGVAKQATISTHHVTPGTSFLGRLPRGVVRTVLCLGPQSSIDVARLGSSSSPLRNDGTNHITL